MCDLLNYDNVFQLSCIGLSSEQFTYSLFLSSQLSTGFYFKIGNMWLIYCGCIYILLIQNASSSRKKIHCCCPDSLFSSGFHKTSSCQTTWEKVVVAECRVVLPPAGVQQQESPSIGRKLMWHLIYSACISPLRNTQEKTGNGQLFGKQQKDLLQTWKTS